MGFRREDSSEVEDEGDDLFPSGSEDSADDREEEAVEDDHKEWT